MFTATAASTKTSGRVFMPRYIGAGGKRLLGVRLAFSARPACHAPGTLIRMERRGILERTTPEKTFQLGKARDAWRETMLDVRLDGEAFALPYAHLSLIKCDGDRMLTLSFSTHLLKIEGERLRPLYEALIDHNVRYVTAAAPRQRDASTSSEPIITGIDLVPLNQGDGGML
jgi:hypothetical protein